MPAPITILLADLTNAGHAAAILDLVEMYARDEMGGGQPLPAEVRANLISGLQAHPGTAVFLAFDGPRPVGIANTFRGFSTFAARPLINIHDLAVHPEYRGRGIGQMLLEHVAMQAKQLGCVKLTLEVRSDNRSAQALYRRCGFQPGSPVQEFWQKRLD